MAMPNHTPPVKMPVLFVGHGSPMNAIESNALTRALEKLGRDLPLPVYAVVWARLEPKLHSLGHA
jgi:aromatic ring-opening dioxygenase catalytic subunit (LigB family)